MRVSKSEKILPEYEGPVSTAKRQKKGRKTQAMERETPPW